MPPQYLKSLHPIHTSLLCVQTTPLPVAHHEQLESCTCLITGAVVIPRDNLLRRDKISFVAGYKTMMVMMVVIVVVLVVVVGVMVVMVVVIIIMMMIIIIIK